jgi:hypothetical protein
MGVEMPKWLKITLIVTGAVLIVTIVGGFLAARAVKRGVENFEANVEQATTEGKEFGSAATLAGCLDEGVRRTADCGGVNITCAPLAGAFIWGCVEAAPYDHTFCSTVPDAEDNDAVMEWGRHVCGARGQPDNNYCIIALATVPGFCTARLNVP